MVILVEIKSTHTLHRCKNQSLQIDSKNYDIPNTSRGMKEKQKLILIGFQERKLYFEKIYIGLKTRY